MKRVILLEEGDVKDLVEAMKDAEEMIEGEFGREHEGLSKWIKHLEEGK